jgi:hypothetical protein
MLKVPPCFKEKAMESFWIFCAPFYNVTSSRVIIPIFGGMDGPGGKLILHVLI